MKINEEVIKEVVSSIGWDHVDMLSFSFVGHVCRVSNASASHM